MVEQIAKENGLPYLQDVESKGGYPMYGFIQAVFETSRTPHEVVGKILSCIYPDLKGVLKEFLGNNYMRFNAIPFKDHAFLRQLEAVYHVAAANVEAKKDILKILYAFAFLAIQHVKDEKHNKSFSGYEILGLEPRDLRYFNNDRSESHVFNLIDTLTQHFIRESSDLTDLGDHILYIRYGMADAYVKLALARMKAMFVVIDDKNETLVGDDDTLKAMRDDAVYMLNKIYKVLSLYYGDARFEETNAQMENIINWVNKNVIEPADQQITGFFVNKAKYPERMGGEKKPAWYKVHPIEFNEVLQLG